MSLFQFLRPEVSNVMSGINKQQSEVTGLLDKINAIVPKVQSAWIGGDADEFAADVGRKIVPAMLEVIAAIGGVNLNLTKATDVVDKADAKVKSLANQLGDIFDKI